MITVGDAEQEAPILRRLELEVQRWRAARLKLPTVEIVGRGELRLRWPGGRVETILRTNIPAELVRTVTALAAAGYPVDWTAWILAREAAS